MNCARHHTDACHDDGMTPESLSARLDRVGRESVVLPRMSIEEAQARARAYYDKPSGYARDSVLSILLVVVVIGIPWAFGMYGLITLISTRGWL